jgi:hypothetical protein
VNRDLARVLVRLYPRAWRDRYGDEFEALLEDRQIGPRDLADMVWHAASERISPILGGTMNFSFGDVVRKPSAFIPLTMSFIALAVLGAAAISGGLVPHRDEGATAHIWQILMAGQLPVLAFFAIKWLPRAPKQTLGVMALQLGAALAAMAPVFLLH